jgi:integrase
MVINLSKDKLPTTQQSPSIILDSAYKNFIHSIKSAATKALYQKGLRYFMDFMKVKENEYYKLLPEGREPKLIQSDIIDFILYIRDQKKLSPASINAYVAALRHFYVMNDVTLNWDKISNFKGEFYDVVEDQPYTHQQIRQMLEKAEPRNRAIILLLASSGMRVGAIPDLKVGDLIPIDKYNIYQIHVYKRFSKKSNRYITFCSSEARKEIDLYLQYRERYGEKITPESPLFRTTFNRDPKDELQIMRNKHSHPLSRAAISYSINELLNITGIRPSAKMTESETHNKRTKLMECHGFRKFFDTTCTSAGMNSLYTEMLMGHNVGLKGRYTKLTPEEILEGNDKNLGYLSAMEHLIICEENRLKSKVKKLQAEKSEISELHEQVSKMSQMYEKLILGLEKSTDKHQINDIIESNFEAGAPKPSVRQDGVFIQKADAFEKFIKNAGYTFDKEIDV